MNFLTFDEDLQNYNSDNYIEDEYTVRDKTVVNDAHIPNRLKYITVDTSTMDAKYHSRPSDFDLVKVIGKGGYGKVLLVKKNNGVDKGSVYAMKVMKKANIIRNEKDTIHTKSERHILENVKHKYIVELMYAFQTNAKLYLVMEYIQGGELFAHLEREVMLNEKSARFYLSEIVIALEYLHMNGVVYRDLKPENILVTRTGDIKLTDFGLCKEHLGGNKTHTFCGTIEYMAPEIVTRTGHDYCADWWSLGALMYDMLTGHPPFSSNDRNHTINMILRGRIMLPHFLSYEARDLLRSLLVRTPEHRLGYGSTNAMLIKKHKFFNSMDWMALFEGRIQPPIIPNIKSPDDTSFFDKTFTSMPPTDTPIENTVCYQGENVFEGFSYVAPCVLESGRRVRAETIGPMPISEFVAIAKEDELGLEVVSSRRAFNAQTVYYNQVRNKISNQPN